MPTAGYAAEDKPTLVVYTYDSFVPSWGAGPPIKQSFETTCDCTVRYVSHIDAVAIASRLALEGGQSRADIVLGVDEVVGARIRHRTAAHKLMPAYAPSLGDWQDSDFIAYDHGWFAFVTRRDLGQRKVLPMSLGALPGSELSIIIQNPRSSSPGLGLLVWVAETQGDGATKWWQDSKDNIVAITAGWSEAYGLFLKGEADAVLSYTTSPAYHAIAEQDDGFDYLQFEEGHVRQVELAAIVATSTQKELARSFLAHLLSPAAQETLTTTQWMLPAVAGATLPEGFEQPANTISVSGDAIEEQRAQWIRTWQRALR
ncbi:MAG: thiamine ABC transporter substrate-binding protein [Alphaproteobacteria bacterium]|nr:thiamine ABC transporter substrate-binding protein [Alphaproteobacteria bacterium]